MSRVTMGSARHLLAFLPTLALFWISCIAQDPDAVDQSKNYTQSGIINLGSVLTTNVNSTWNSRNGTFALGFHPVGLRTYTLSIWYAAISVRTVVWTANRNSLVIEGATLSFRGDGNLVLQDSLQIHPIWETNTSSLNVFTAELLDTGNFVLRNAQLDVVWDSFRSPSDTLLPNQKLSAGVELTSAHTNKNAALGRYSLKQDPDGHLRLYYLPSLSQYWTASFDNSSYTSDSFSYLNSSGFFALYNSSGSVLASWMTIDVGSGPLRYLRLGVGGDLRIYSWSPQLLSWVVVWKALSDECSAIDMCGSYGLCSYEPHPVCSCPPKFALVDAEDISQGCQAPLPLNCSASKKFLRLDNTRYGGEDYILLTGVTEEECLDRCSQDCACLGIFYFYNGNGTCSLKSALQSGHIDPTGNSYVKVNGMMNLTGDAVGESPRRDSQRTLVRPQIVVGIVCGFTLACFLFMACSYHWWKTVRSMHHRDRIGNLWSLKDFVPGAPTRFAFKDLQLATSNFSLELGSGSGNLGKVYKGELPDGTPIAVKRLERSHGQLHHVGEEQFKLEAAIIASTHHKNLVRLYGFCCEGSADRLLVYELVANGSLAKFLFLKELHESGRGLNLNLAQVIAESSSASSSSSSGPVAYLDWKRRFKVILGTARAMAYLHEQCGEHIVHGTITVENVLLDEQYEAKISDFGVAKLVLGSQKLADTDLNTMGKKKSKMCSLLGGSLCGGGTRGSPASESYNLSEPLTDHSVKSDVYGFGVLVLEIVGGRKRNHIALDMKKRSTRTNGRTTLGGQQRHHQPATESFHRAFTQGAISEILDKNLGTSYNSQEAERAFQAAAWCLQDDPETRPSMGKVVHILEGLIPVPSPAPVATATTAHVQRSNSGSNDAVTPDHAVSATLEGTINFDLNSPLISKIEL